MSETAKQYFTQNWPTEMSFSCCSGCSDQNQCFMSITVFCVLCACVIFSSGTLKYEWDSGWSVIRAPLWSQRLFLFLCAPCDHGTNGSVWIVAISDASFAITPMHSQGRAHTPAWQLEFWGTAGVNRRESIIPTILTTNFLCCFDSSCEQAQQGSGMLYIFLTLRHEQKELF